MASGHVNRVNRPNTWPQPTSCTVKKTLANREPSTHGRFADVPKLMAERPILTLSRHYLRPTLLQAPPLSSEQERHGVPDCRCKGLAPADVKGSLPDARRHVRRERHAEELLIESGPARRRDCQQANVVEGAQRRGEVQILAVVGEARAPIVSQFFDKAAETTSTCMDQSGAHAERP